MEILRFLLYILKKALVPIALVLVWFYDIRPLTFVDEILSMDLMLKINKMNLPPAIIGAIDVAILTFFITLISDAVNKFFTKPIELTIKLGPSNSNADSVTIKYDPDKEEADQISVKLSGQIYKFYKTIKFIFRGIKVKIYWHPRFLSVTLKDYVSDEMLIVKDMPGAIYFDILNLFSDSDDILDQPIKLYIRANSDKKREGKITAKIEVNSENKFICLCFNGILNSLIKLKIESCKIHIAKES
ncbi:hypothetical protein [Peribacillus butanolivorans]|uniref:hypothetical protein n=1 Tax=Peribacillus butanolivorans TaxID=421767 RepID=UPI00366C9ACF